MNETSMLVCGLSRRPGASDEVIAANEGLLKRSLPSEYIEFVKLSNGGEGFVGKDAYVMFWGVDELVSLNLSYEVEKNAPGLLLFGSDGGGEAYGFDTRNQYWHVVQVPFIGMSWESAQPMGATFRAFLERLAGLGE